MLKIGVMFGGTSVEHEVSIISAVQAMHNLDTEKYDVIPIYMGKDRVWYTGKQLMDIELYKDMDLLKRYAKQVIMYKKNNEFVLQNTKGLRRIVDTVDLVLPVVHGSGVEDGTLQGFLETIGVPYVGSNVLGSALGQDKVVMKEVMKMHDLPVVPYTCIYDYEMNDFDNVLKNVKKIGYPVIIKPANLGSSIGITIAHTENELESSLRDAFVYEKKVAVEKKLESITEVNASVLGDYEYCEVSPLEEVMGEDEILSYSDKYLGSSKTKGSKGMASASRRIPADLDEKVTEKIKEYAKETFKALNLSGVARIDFMIDKKSKNIYVNEPNTCPGSLSFYLWDAAGKKYPELLDDMINIAIKDYKNKESKVHSFSSNILSGAGIKGCKGLKK